MDGFDAAIDYLECQCAAYKVIERRDTLAATSEACAAGNRPEGSG